MNPVDQFQVVEIDEKSNGNVQQLHETQKLRLVDQSRFFNRLGLDQEAVFNQQIAPQSLFANEALVFDPNDLLTGKGNST
jgi:hypothetical protein